MCAMRSFHQRKLFFLANQVRKLLFYPQTLVKEISVPRKPLIPSDQCVHVCEWVTILYYCSFYQKEPLILFLEGMAIKTLKWIALLNLI